MLCNPCYTCARTRYGCKSFILWTVISVIFNFFMMQAAVGAAASMDVQTTQATMSTRSTDDVIADLTHQLTTCEAASMSNESLNTQSLLAQLERDIDNME